MPAPFLTPNTVTKPQSLGVPKIPQNFKPIPWKYQLQSLEWYESDEIYEQVHHNLTRMNDRSVKHATLCPQEIDWKRVKMVGKEHIKT